MTAGVLWTNVFVHKEFSGLDIKLFGDVVTDFDQILTALTAGAGFGCMIVFNALQMIG